MNRSIILGACLMQTSLWAQISPLPPPNPLPDFAIDFGAAPPPSYIGGVTYLVVSDFPYLNFNLGYFTVPATSAWLAKRQADNSLTPMFQMYPQTANVVGAGLVYSYTPGFPINNSAIRVADFLAGLWYVQFHFGSATYTAQIVPIPDTQPPQIVVAVTPNVLWPPNHRMVPISVVVNALDNQDPSPVARITQVTSNEPGNSSSPDWEITGPLTLNLRAKRLGKGNGRIYTIVVECEDASGNVSSASISVSVPHHKGFGQRTRGIRPITARTNASRRIGS